MIVISGKYRGRKLVCLDGLNTRPTTARIKEDMFNILNNYFIFENKVSLDLFAGSGGLSIEGLSRGIKTIYVNDHYRPAIDVINENLKGISKNEYVIFQKDYKELMELLKIKGNSFDLIYLDPPFSELEYYYDFFNKVIDYKLLNLWGVVIVESAEKLDLELIKELTLLKQKDYKNKNLYFFRLEGE